MKRKKGGWGRGGREVEVEAEAEQKKKTTTTTTTTTDDEKGEGEKRRNKERKDMKIGGKEDKLSVYNPQLSVKSQKIPNSQKHPKKEKSWSHYTS